MAITFVPEAAEEAITTIDAEITKLEARLRQLRARRNSLILVNRIPPELLQEVMHYVKAISPNEEYRSYSWIKVAQICRHWREVALGCSSLWATLFLPSASTRWLKVLCKRSRSVPLSLVDIHGHAGVELKGKGTKKARLLHPYESEEIAELIESQLHRIQALKFALDEENMQVILTQLKSSAPLLKHLAIRGLEDLHHPLPVDIFGGSIPKLRYLRLDNCMFGWNSPLLVHTLHDLQISMPSTRLRVNDISAVFSSLPCLRNLELELALPEVSDIDWDGLSFGEGSIQLPPSLHTLSLRELNCQNMAEFLSRIFIHDGVHLRLRPVGLYFGRFLGKIAYKALQSKPASTSLYSGFNLRMEVNQLYETRAEEFVLTFSNSTNDQICFEIGTIDEDDLLFPIVQCCSMIRELPLHNLKALTISGRIIPQGPIIRALSQTQNLEVITLNRKEYGVLSFVGELVDQIPQCSIHEQNGRCRRSWKYAEVGYEVHRGEYDEDSEGSIYDSEDEDGGDTYEALRSDVAPCPDCKELGKSYFPALRRLIVRDVKMGNWRVMNEERKRINPVAEFIVRRIRCGLRIEELVFEPCREQQEFRMAGVVYDKQLQELCGAFRPLVKIKHFIHWDYYNEMKVVEGFDSEDEL